MTKLRTMNTSYRIWTVFALLLFMLSSCQAPFSAKPRPVIIGVPGLEQNALIFIAEEQGFFEQNGLLVTIQEYDSGVLSLDALRGEQVDLAVAAEFPVVRSLLNKEPLMIIASADKFENDYLIARKDRGIQQISDLRGKRIGLARHTINEFFLARFLELNGIRVEDVTQVDLKPAEFVDALVSGQVDALIAWQPYIQRAEQQLKEPIIWAAQSSQFVYSVLVARRGWLEENPQTAALFLKALAEAENYIARQPDEAKTIVQKRLNYSDEYISNVWSDHAFSLTLDNSLMVAMNDEARWLIRSGLSTGVESPDFYDVIYSDGLKSIKPEAVTIHR